MLWALSNLCAKIWGWLQLKAELKSIKSRRTKDFAHYKCDPVIFSKVLSASSTPLHDLLAFSLRGRLAPQACSHLRILELFFLARDNNWILPHTGKSVEMEWQWKDETEDVCQLFSRIFKNTTSNSIRAGSFPSFNSLEKSNNFVPVNLYAILPINNIVKNCQGGALR